MTNKPNILLLTLANNNDIALDRYVNVTYYNRSMPKEEFFEYAKDADLILESEYNDGVSVYADLLNQVNNKKAVWLIDTHVRPDQPQYANNFDYVFVSINRLRYKFTCPTIHLPVGFLYSESLITNPNEIRKNDISFVGNIHNLRTHFFDQLLKKLNEKNIRNSFIKGLFKQDYANLTRDSYIGFNSSIAGELNLRAFETLAFGATLLTDFNEEYTKVPELQDRSYSYKSFEELILRIDEILTIPKNVLLKNNIDNQQWLKQNHLVLHRYLYILKHCIGFEPKIN